MQLRLRRLARKGLKWSRFTQNTDETFQGAENSSRDRRHKFSWYCRKERWETDKGLVDRNLGISEDGDGKLCLCEFKARVKQLEAQKEQDRINLLRGNHLIWGKMISLWKWTQMILCRTWELPNLMMMSASPQTLTQPPPARHEAVIRSLRCIYTLNPSIDFEYISMGVWIDC